ncbi:DNA-binding IscR family transcriptional regulator [Desulfofundulus luciae]|uniref:DNA-binding IscR family transcriptional regulator n=1 Tax=Desulfofundulus luciae TaxID=74702 RepID=A0ABU0B5E6_9FIRM|nr:FeoC-like transcriptional regulator [Desulfofundulus luciae]MDQ0287718.1 DNA-binding IscR family transcriptional regulator [Desulfofundulus luciae]
MVRRIREKTVPPGGPLTRRQKKAAGEAVIRLLGRASGNISELAEHLGLDEELIDQLLQELVRVGRVRRNPDGGFSLHDPLSKWWESKGS